MQNEQLRDLYSSPSNQVKEDEMGRSCIMKGEKRNTFRLLVGKPGGKRPLGKP
jgi:hypothetical protein